MLPSGTARAAASAPTAELGEKLSSISGKCSALLIRDYREIDPGFDTRALQYSSRYISIAELIENRMNKLLPATRLRAPSSRVLQDLVAQAPADFFTLAWLTSFLRERSFGIMLLFAGLLGTIPVGSTIPGLMLLALAIQLIAGWSEPVLPGFISHRPLPTQHLLSVGRRAIPVLLFLERAVHPRWPRVFDVLKRGIGVLILLLTAALLLTPVPLSNVAPAVIISLMSLAYVEEDGLLLTLSVAAATGFMFLISVAIFGLIFLSHV